MTASTQAVEAAVELLAHFQTRLGSRRENCENKALWDKINVASAGLHSIRAALTSQQEVAAPVGIDEAVQIAFESTNNGPDRALNEHWFRKGYTLAASRDQVNLAACGGGGVTEWQPIETAPKDGLVDLLTDGGRRYQDCYWDGICAEWRHITACGKLISFRNAAHWMQPPAAPKAQEGGK